jgi:hypothetical protein
MISYENILKEYVIINKVSKRVLDNLVYIVNPVNLYNKVRGFSVAVFHFNHHGTYSNIHVVTKLCFGELHLKAYPVKKGFS